MSGLKFYSYEGMGHQLLRDLGYSQAVRVAIELKSVVKAAGGKGWSQVFRVNTTHLPLNEEAMAAVQRNFKKYMPDHQPLWTALGVQRFGADRMAVEIEAVAYDPEGAKAAGSK
ncbi:hypothetical protein ACHAPV_004708 [Trichoderma viride]